MTKALDTASYTARLEAAIAAKGTALCLGIDPHRHGALPPFLQEQAARDGWPSAVRAWGCALIEAASPVVPAVKLQTAFFEAMGWQGWQILAELTALAKSRGLITLIDAKRGDIASTMAAYGEMAFEALGGDALTVQPYLGFDVLAPLLPWLRQGKGVYLVWLTSNQAGRLVQGFCDGAAKSLTSLIYQEFSTRLAAEGVSASLGLVVGATRMLEIPADEFASLEQHPLLLPGIGEQGAVVSGRLAGLLAKPSRHLLPQSRSLTGLGSRQINALSAASSLAAYLSAFEDNLRASL